MTREEEINKEAYRVSCNGDEFSSFIQAAEWADKTMIDKACEWLDNNKHLHKEIFFGSLSTDWDKFIGEFRKAMEE